MRINRRKKTGHVRPPTAAMGDIAFLLIIFFMLSSQFTRESHIHLETPAAPDVQDLERTAIWVSLDEAGDVWVDGEASSLTAVGGQVRNLIERLGRNDVLVRVDRDALRHQYETLLIELTLAGGTLSVVGREMSAP